MSDKIHVEKKTYGYAGKTVLKDVDITIEQGEFVLVCGANKSGKTTFLKMLYEMMPDKAGMLVQNPDNQTVHDKVLSELASVLSAKGLPDSEIWKKIGEVSGYFGISRWIERDTASLSGGEKQLLNLAVVMTDNPKVLLLDEPLAMLDPVMADRILNIVKDLNLRLGITVIMASHIMDELFATADRVCFIENGHIISDTPRKTAQSLVSDNKYRYFLPEPARVFYKENELPFTVSEGRKMLDKYEGTLNAGKSGDTGKETSCTALEFSNVSFGYDKFSGLILSSLNLQIMKGEIFALAGENGSGKTTAALLAAGYYRPYSGTIKAFGKRIKSPYENCAILFQDVTCHFTEDSYEKDGEQIHPYDLSGGEKQKLALDLIMAQNPSLLILDEPAKYLDGYEKHNLVARLKELKAEGVTILIITHDMSFAAETADRIGLLFGGRISACGTPEEFFKGNSFYTTPVARIFSDKDDSVITVQEALEVLGIE